MGELLGRRAFAELKAVLGRFDLGSLAAVWGNFPVLERMILFKLLEAPRAAELWRLVSFEERYLLLMAQPREALGPELEAAGGKGLFHELPRAEAGRMTRELIAEARRRG